MSLIIGEEVGGLKNIFSRFRRKDFSGTTGQAIKNSSYQLAQNLIFKFGSLLFTIVVARMLLPDLMGLYNLALATIILFASFSDLGIGSALMTYVARLLEKGGKEKAKGYVKQLFKWKLWLTFISTGMLLTSAYFVAEIYYAKPIFYALLVGGLYLPIVSILGFVETIFKASENFKIPLKKEILFQITRLILVSLSIFLFLKNGLSDWGIVFVTLLALVLSYSMTFLFLLFQTKKQIKFLQVDPSDLNKKEKIDLRKFIYPLSAIAMSGLFFGYVDTLMLGHFVLSKYLAYYGAAFSLVGGASAIIGFMSIAFMPIFAKKNGVALESIFSKTRNLIVLISILAGIFTYFVAYYVIKIAYGVEYLGSVPILQWFSILVVLIPILGIYTSYYITQKKTKKLAWMILGSAILNIVLNWFGITFGLENYGEMGAVFGAVGATIFSRILYLGALVFWKNK